MFEGLNVGSTVGNLVGFTDDGLLDGNRVGIAVGLVGDTIGGCGTVGSFVIDIEGI